LSEKLLDLFILVQCEAVLPESLRREGRNRRGGHGEALLSHFEARGGRAVCRTGKASRWTLEKLTLEKLTLENLQRAALR
jgi:hypothetical protein